MLTLYARKEPTVDPVSLNLGLGGKLDSVLYRDRACTEPAARWPWHYASCPKPGQKQVMFNCYRWNLVWVPDAPPTVQ